jgi:hypothetical protein
MSAYITLDGTQYFTTPDTAALQLEDDIDIRVKLAATDYTPVAAQRIVHNRSGNNGYEMYFDAGGVFIVRHGNGTDSRIAAPQAAAVAATDGIAYVWRATLDVSTGAWTYYKNGVQIDTDTVATGAAVPAAATLGVAADGAGNSKLIGKLYWVEVRTGIDGSIVARVDAADIIRALGTTPDDLATWVGSADGLTWTVRGSGAVGSHLLSARHRLASVGQVLRTG